jgi:hypothetical protein
MSLWHIPCNKQGKRNGGATDEPSNSPSNRTTGRCREDIQALAIFSVLLARVTGAQDDGWVATVEQNLQRAWGASNVIVGIPAPLPAHIPDFTVQNEGTIYILYAQTDAARAWVNEHLPTDRTTWGGNGTVIEHRYITDIIDGIKESGLSVR